MGLADCLNGKVTTQTPEVKSEWIKPLDSGFKNKVFSQSFEHKGSLIGLCATTTTSATKVLHVRTPLFNRNNKAKATYSKGPF